MYRLYTKLSIHYVRKFYNINCSKANAEQAYVGWWEEWRSFQRKAWDRKPTDIRVCLKQLAKPIGCYCAWQVTPKSCQHCAWQVTEVNFAPWCHLQTRQAGPRLCAGVRNAFCTAEYEWPSLWRERKKQHCTVQRPAGGEWTSVVSLVLVLISKGSPSCELVSSMDNWVDLTRLLFFGNVNNWCKYLNFCTSVDVFLFFVVRYLASDAGEAICDIYIKLRTVWN